MAENSKNLFLGFKQVFGTPKDGFENGYLYFVRTSTGTTDGYLVLNGKKYGTAEEAKALIAKTKADILGDIEGKDPNTIAGLSVAINALAEIVGSGFTGETDITKEIEDLKTTVGTLIGGDSSIDARIESAIKALNLDETYEAKGAASSALTEAKAHTDEVVSSALTEAKAHTDEVVSSATTRITTLEGKAHTHANADVLSGITAGKVSAWDSAEQNAKDYTDQVVSSATTRITALEGKAHEHENKELLDTYTQTNADLTDAVAKKHEHTNADVLNGITAEQVTAWGKAEANAKAYADGAASTAAASALTAANAYTDKVVSSATTRITALEGKVTAWDSAEQNAKDYAKTYTDKLANGAVKTNTEAIEKLNGTGEGSVSKQVADAIAEVVANAPENLDTLKEIADYIASDPQGVAELSNKVTTLEGKAHTHANADVLSGITTEKVSAWDSAEQNAKAYADGLASNYDAAGAAASAAASALTSAKAYADGLASNYDAAGAAASAAASALTAAQTYADGLNTAMDTRVKELEGDSHEHGNKAELDLIKSGYVAKWNAAYSALTIDGDDVD